MSLLTLFYRQVVFDLRRGLADLIRLKVWLASIHSRAPGCPVIVVGTHKDKLTQGICLITHDDRKNMTLNKQ